MGHLTARNYLGLQKRLDRFVPGVYDSKHLYEILKILFTDEEAKLCSLMPLNFTTVKQLSKIWKKKEADEKKDGQRKAILSPPVLGFFEFSLMRTDGKFDKKKLSELYYKYINVEDGFIKRYLTINPPISRVFVHEDAIKDMTSEVLSYERVSDGINNSSCITVGTCFCRHKMEHMGMACDNPQDVCLTFNNVAKYLAEHNIARKITKDEAHKIIDLCINKGLVQIGDNTKDDLVIICNCCGCCCDLLLAYKRLGTSHIITPSNYEANINKDTCSGCGTCIEKCPINAISKINNKPVVDKKFCLGCGVCTRFCTANSCKMEHRPEKVFVPNDTLERIALGAIHRGKLGNFLFDNQNSIAHKILRKLLNFLIKLPPVKKILLNKQIHSRLFMLLKNSEKYSTLKEESD
jgi:Pyruvate/2-oxoacid:ferredoxin oxidoreductase delta subunit